MTQLSPLYLDNIEFDNGLGETVTWVRQENLCQAKLYPGLGHELKMDAEDAQRVLSVNAKWKQFSKEIERVVEELSHLEADLRKLESRASQTAQAKAKAIYTVNEIDVSNLDGYVKEYAPKAQALIKASGGQLLAAGQNVKSYEGAPPAKRIAIQRWDSAEQYEKYRNSAGFKENRKIGDKYAKFRAYSVEANN